MLLGKCALGFPHARLLNKNQGCAGAAEVSGDPDLGVPGGSASPLTHHFLMVNLELLGLFSSVMRTLGQVPHQCAVSDWPALCWKHTVQNAPGQPVMPSVTPNLVFMGFCPFSKKI